MAGRAFEDLTYRGQAGRMRALAREALPRFGLSRKTKLELCGYGENAVFGVHQRGRIRYALRIHRLDYQTPATIESEMHWLEALDRDTDLTVQKPCAGKNGTYVQRVALDGVPGERSVVLMGWVDGRRAGMTRPRAYLERIGELTAALHEHGKTWKRPKGFTRRRWDERELLIEPAFGDPMSAPGLRKADRALFERCRRRVLKRLAAFGKGRKRWGLIHADLHGWNVVKHEGEVRPIDFDDCGFGWYVYDILVCAAGFLWGQPGYNEKMSWFLDGYRRVRPFDDADLDMVEPFRVVRHLDMLGWVASRSDNPRLASYLPDMLKRTRKACREYVGR